MNPSTQEKVIEGIINNRNQQSQINSEEAAIHVLKSGKINQFIVDNWYNGMLRLIDKLRIHSDVNEDVFLELSPERNVHLSEKLKNLIQVLRQLLLLLEKSRM